MPYRFTNYLTDCPARCRSDQNGFSLIETLVAAVIFSMVGAAIFAGVAMVTRTDANQQARSAASVASQNYSDALLAAPYVTCAPTSAYAPGEVGLSTQDKVTVSVKNVSYWNGSELPSAVNATASQWDAAFVADCPPDQGLQRITYEVTSTVGDRTVAKDVSVLKRSSDPLETPPVDPPAGGRACVISDPARVRSTWVNQASPNTNYSSGSGNQEMNILYTDGTRRFSYVRFDVKPGVACDNGGTLPNSATIIAAQVRIYTFNIGGFPACGANSCWHVVERVRGTGLPDDVWKESTLNWNNQPCPKQFGASCQADGKASTILFEHGTGALDWSARFQRIQSTQLVNDVRSFYQNPDSNYGWVIKEACAITYNRACGSALPGFQMRSSRATQVDQRPTLTVWY